jgi:hypothetical protein
MYNARSFDGYELRPEFIYVSCVLKDVNVCICVPLLRATFVYPQFIAKAFGFYFDPNLSVVIIE